MGISEIAKQEGIDINIADKYEEIKIVEYTGWTLEYIRDLGLLDRESILQIKEGLNAANRR